MRVDNSVKKKSLEILAQHNRKRWLCKRPGRRERNEEYESEATSCTLVERDSSQVNQLRVQTGRKKMINVDWWLLILWHVVPSPGKKQAGQAGPATLLPWQGWAEGACGGVKQNAGCQEATYLHYLTIDALTLWKKSIWCMLINTALQHYLPTVVPDIKQFLSSSSTGLTLRF